MSIFSKFSKEGFIPSSILLLGILGHKSAFALGYIIICLNQAQKNNLSKDNDFLLDTSRALSVLHFNMEDLRKAIEELSDKGMIDEYKSYIEGCFYIRVYFDKIMQFIQEEKDNHCMGSWDDGLLYSLNPICSKQSFSETTAEIKTFLDERLKSADTIPLIYYAYLNDSVIEYEVILGNLADSFPIYQTLYQNVCCVPVETARLKFINIADKIYDLSLEAKKAKELQPPIIDEIPPDDYF